MKRMSPTGLIDRFQKSKAIIRYVFYSLIIILMANLYALMDFALYPDEFIFTKEHLVVGGMMSLLAIIVSILLESVSKKGKPSAQFTSRMGMYTWFLAAFWTIILVVSLSFNIIRQKQETFEVALSEARTIFEKDLISYRWASGHNGVFVPITERTKPNPYLMGFPENMIRTSSGKAFTLVNPEYMIRQIYDMQEARHGALGHITSLDPIRSENAADEWETLALEAFEDGKGEVHSIETINDEPYLRLMRPLITEEGCLKCHAPQGYDLGDIRGGISVSVPMSLLLAIYKKDIAMFSLAHFALWILGIMGIFAGSYRIRESISEREQAEERTRSIIENMLDGLITLDEQGIIESLNASASRIFGYNSDEVVGQKVNLLVQFPQDWSEIQDQELHTDITRAMGAPLEVTGRRKDGSTFSLEISMSEMLFGAMRHFIVMTRDITEEKIKKAEALRAGQLAAIGEIAAGVAHEINNPINGIINLTQILLDGTDPEASPEGSEDREILSRIISEGDRISGIVRNLLDFARQRDEIVEEFMIETVIKDSISLLEYQFRKDGITWTMDVASNSPYLRGNPQQLQQVFLNLLSNARYSLNMRYKGQDPEKRFEINSFVITQEGKEYLRTTVTDFGTGMSQDVIDKIFDPLFSTKPPGEGTGLGLSISQNLVMEHQGYLRFESTIGDHTTAIVDLPIPSISDQNRQRH